MTILAKATVLALAVVAVAVPTVADFANVTGESTRIVLVSGRDDHGLPVADRLPLHDRPGGASIGSVAADTLVEVHATSGTWLRIASVEGDPVAGWIDEFLVRGELHVVLPDAPACPAPTAQGGLPASTRVRVVAVHLVQGTPHVSVSAVTGDGTTHEVERGWLRELPGPEPVPGADCSDVREAPVPVHDH